MKWRNLYIKLVQWAIVVLAYAYLIYRLVSFDNYETLLYHFNNVGILQWGYLLLAFLLFPLNICAEAWKWQYLLKDIEPMSYHEAIRQTYFGFVAAFLTPARLGDYPARVSMLKNKQNWITAIAMGFVGTLALAFVQVAAGLPSSLFLFSNILNNAAYKTTIIIIGVATIILLVFLIVFYRKIALLLLPYSLKNEKIALTLRTLSTFSHKRFITTCFMSIIRYIIYCAQLYFVLVFCGVNFTFFQTIIAIPTYYLLVTITPSVPIADVAIRGGWSMVVFGVFTENIAGVALAAVLLWVLNSILPMLVGSVVKKQE